MNNISSIWSLILTTSSLQLSLFYKENKQADLAETLRELEPYYGLPEVEQYDYIVVGGGAAGCLVAGKLSESGFSVLLVEKGGDPPPPIMSQLLVGVRFHPIVNDVYHSTLQAHAYGKNHGMGTMSQGIMLGGSSSHNVMKYNRGSPEFYDEWAEIVGDPSFSYGSMLQYYKEIEDMQGFLFNENERSEFYGVGGPFSVETNLPASFGDWFEAGQFLGFKAADPNAHLEQSFTTLQVSTRNSTRETSCTAFIFRRPNPNLRIHRYSNALKILTEEGAAVGVVYLRHGIAQVSMATKEVIVTAGPFGSPVLLLRSGIGPRNLLEQAGIPVVLDLPGVGAFLQDQPYTHVLFNQEVPEPDDKQLVSFLSSFPGGRGATGALGLQAFIRTSVAPWTGSWPDIQITFEESPLYPSQARIGISLARPKSSGFLWINTTSLSLNEVDATKIVRPNPAYFEEPEDMDAMVEGLKFLFLRLLQTPQLRARNLAFIGNISEGCESYEQFSKGFWVCFVERRTTNFFQFVGTAKMGNDGDEMRVVDSSFRVVGLRNLRVADSSVIPKTPNGNTQAVILAMSAKAVHDILSE